MKLGTSDQRNAEYMASVTDDMYFRALLGRKDPIIFDVGAHKGESVVFFKSIFPAATIYSFEPDNQSYVELEKHSADAKVFNMAVSDKTGELSFYKQQISHLNSLIKVNRKSKDSITFAESAKNQKVTVKAITLDDFFVQHQISHVDLLKIDVQGAEAKVLKGGTHSLSMVDVITLELSFFDFYAVHTSFYEIERCLRKHGFELWDIAKVSKNPKNYRTDWAEVVYKRI